MDFTGKILCNFLKQFPLTSSMGDKFDFCIVMHNSTQIVMLTGYFALAEFKINVLVNYATKFPRISYWHV